MMPDQTTKSFTGRAHVQGPAQGRAHSSTQPSQAVLGREGARAERGSGVCRAPRGDEGKPHRGPLRTGSGRRPASPSEGAGSGSRFGHPAKAAAPGRPWSRFSGSRQRSARGRCGMRQRSKRRGRRTRDHAPRPRRSPSASSGPPPPQPGPHGSADGAWRQRLCCRSPRARRSGVRVPRPSRGCTASAAPHRPRGEHAARGDLTRTRPEPPGPPPPSASAGRACACPSANAHAARTAAPTSRSVAIATGPGNREACGRRAGGLRGPAPWRARAGTCGRSSSSPRRRITSGWRRSPGTSRSCAAAPRSTTSWTTATRCSCGRSARTPASPSPTRYGPRWAPRSGPAHLPSGTPPARAPSPGTPAASPLGTPPGAGPAQPLSGTPHSGSPLSRTRFSPPSTCLLDTPPPAASPPHLPPLGLLLRGSSLISPSPPPAAGLPARCAELHSRT